MTTAREYFTGRSALITEAGRSIRLDVGRYFAAEPTRGSAVALGAPAMSEFGKVLRRDPYSNHTLFVRSVSDCEPGYIPAILKART